MKKLFIFLLLLCGCSKVQPIETEGISYLPLGMYMDVIQYEKDQITVEIRNESGYTMEYGNEYGIQKLENEEWIDIQPKEEIVWTMETHVIEDLETKEETYDLSHYDLEKGSYRLVKDDLYATFEVK